MFRSVLCLLIGLSSTATSVSAPTPNSRKAPSADQIKQAIENLGNKRWAAYGPGGMSQAVPRMVLKKHGVDFSSAQFLAVGGEASRLSLATFGIVSLSNIC